MVRRSTGIKPPPSKAPRSKDVPGGPAPKRLRSSTSTSTSTPSAPFSSSAAPRLPPSPSQPLAVDDLGRFLASSPPASPRSPSLLHQHGIRSERDIVGMVLLPKSLLVAALGELETAGVSKLAKKIVVKKFGEVRESLGVQRAGDNNRRWGSCL